MVTGSTAGVPRPAEVGGSTAASTPALQQASPPFSGMLQSLIEQANALDRKASATVAGLLNGQGVDVHDAMIATQKADMAFELALQVRNKAVAAYQQMMGMQF